MDKTSICNQALAQLASSAELTNVETDRTKEAQACRLFYDTARDAVLRAFPWPFATQLGALGLIEADPNDEWDFSYSYPEDSLHFRRILNAAIGRVDVHSTRVPYRIIGSDAGKIILTDAADAQGEWTTRIEDPEMFAPDFVVALQFYLASLIAPRVTAGDQFKLGNACMQQYQFAIRRAQMTAAREEQADDRPDAEMILFRE